MSALTWRWHPRSRAAPATSSGPRGAPFDRRHLAVLGALLVLGTGIRLWIAFTNYGFLYDINSAYIVSHLLATHPLIVYSSLRYPYPGGFLPVILLCREIADVTGAAFWAVFKVPSILGDAGIAAVLAWGLRRLGSTPRERLVAVGLVALGPSFVLISGYHGQIDAVAIVPALAGVIVWQRGGERRAWQAGLLVGVGAAIKTVPVFMALAMLPTARTRREAGIVLAVALAVPLGSLVPFLLADAHGVLKALRVNQGVPGFGGLNVLISPGLLHAWLNGRLPHVSGVAWFLWRKQNLIVAAAILLAAAYAVRRRMDVPSAATLIWLVLYMANPNWAYQYFVWGLPFFLLAGYRREVAALQLLLALPAAALYFHFGFPTFKWLSLPLLDIAWAAIAFSVLLLVRRQRATR